MMTYPQAIKYIENMPRSKAKVFTGQAGLMRAVKFFKALGNPQNKIKTIHIAGTSGKGTTAMIISRLLNGSGYNVGLALSPHVYDIRERCQINNQMISKQSFAQTLEKIIPIVSKLNKQGYEVSYFELLLGIGFTHFIDQKVDYAVIETGLGGLLDASNTIENTTKVAVITRIGKDHTNVLGNDIQEIAIQKAGIIQYRNQVIALSQSPTINTVIEKRARLKNASIKWVSLKRVTRISTPPTHLKTEFQKENYKLAYETVRYLAIRDGWNFNEKMALEYLRSLQIPGRFEEIKKHNKIFILDGAHNPQKLKAVMEAVEQLYPSQKLGLILAMQSSKEIPRIHSNFLVLCTRYTNNSQDISILPYDPETLASRLKSKNKATAVHAMENFPLAIEYAYQSNIKVWLVSGTFFLLAEAKAAHTKEI